MATAHLWAASEASSVVEAAEVTLSFPIGVWVVAVLLNLPAWTFRAICPSVTVFVIQKCDCPIYWITTRWPKSSNRRPHGSHFSTSAAMLTPNSSSALSLGKHPFKLSLTKKTYKLDVTFSVRLLVPCASIGPSIHVAGSANVFDTAAKDAWKLTAIRGQICSDATNSRWITICASDLSLLALRRKVRISTKFSLSIYTIRVTELY